MDDTAARWRSSGRDHWPFTLAAVHLLHTLWFAAVYPEVVYDPDLLAYFVYFRNWLTGTTSLHDAAWFTVPKPFLVFVLGPLDSAPAVFAVSALAAGAFGALVYLIAREAFGRTVAVLCSLMLLLDVDRANLAARASADFYLAVFVYAAIHAVLVRRWVLAGVALALAGLVKPVALLCALPLLAIAGADRRRAWAAAALALVALPLTLLSNQALLGSAVGTQRLFAGFATMTDGTQMPPGDILRFVLWVGLVKTVFTATAPFGVVGLAVWIGRDKSRLTHPFFLAPLALLGGYVVLSLTTPFVAYFRFFWPVQVWFACFVVFGIVETCRCLAPEPRALRLGITAALLFFLFDEQMARQLRYRSHYASPYEDAMAFVSQTDGLLASERTQGETILTPLALFPYLLWTIDDARLHPTLIHMAEVQDENGSAPPDWVLYVPQFFLRQEARARVDALLSSGLYEPLMGSGEIGALYIRRDHREPLARLDRPR